jgi:hypothetical protein
MSAVAPEDFSAVIDRFREIATASADALVADGPVSPDHELLDVCAEALALFRDSAALDAQRQRQVMTPWTDATRKRDWELCEQSHEANRAASGKLRRIRNLRAVTPAGIYAKALVVRQSKTGAVDLARSLAEDLVSNAPCSGEARHEHRTVGT